MELERRGVLVDRRPERDFGPVLEWLAARDVVMLLVEGGPRLHAALDEAGFVDRVQVVETPHRLGEGVPTWTGGAVADPAGRPVQMLGEDTLSEFDVHGTD